LGRAEPPRPLDERQGVAVGEVPAPDGDESHHARIAQQRDGRITVEAAEVDAGEARLVEGAVHARALREGETHPVGVAAVGGEDEGLEARGVDPVGVVDHDQHRRRVGAERQQRQGGGVHGQHRGLGPFEPERPPQGLGLHVGQVVEPVQQRAEDRGQAAEGQTPLELDAGDSQDLEPAAPGGAGRPVQQRRLALPGLALHDDDRRPVGGDVVEHAREHAQLRLPPQRHLPWSCPKLDMQAPARLPFPAGRA
jgi:hypothetical protein